MIEPAVARGAAAPPRRRAVARRPRRAVGRARRRSAARVKRIGFTAWTALPAVLRDLDVNLAPLTPGSRFNEAKSAIKWLEAALVGTPTVASPTEPFREAIEHGRNGLLATTPDDWVAAIDALLTDRVEAPAPRRPRPSRRAASLVAPPASPRVLRRNPAVGRARDRHSTWADVVAPSEPYVDRPLEPYELPRRWSVALPPPLRHAVPAHAGVRYGARTARCGATDRSASSNGSQDAYVVRRRSPKRDEAFDPTVHERVRLRGSDAAATTR